MRITTDSVITLEGNEKYVYVKDCEYEGSRYILLMGIEDDEETLIPNKMLIAEEAEENGELFIDVITDQDLIIRLTRLFKVEEK